MKYGTGLPLIAVKDVGAIRDIAQTFDGAGFDYVTAAGHLLATSADRYQGRPAATFSGPFHDPFVLFSYLSAVTSRIHFFTGILILPLYETAVVAKQALELDFVSGGRFELGVGISWQDAEYEAVGQDVHERGARLAEQAQVLRKYWTEPLFSFEGRWHHIDNMGLNRLPEHPIPLWFGSSMEDRPLKRAARYADGWMPMGDPTEHIDRFRKYAAEAGRDPASIKLMARVSAGDGGPDAWVAEGKRLQAIGATHLTIGAPPDLTGAAATQRLIEAKDALASALG